jgi:hypothetical protein
MLNLRKKGCRWNVDVDPEAIRAAIGQIDHAYSGTSRIDMFGWLERFLENVYDDPHSVLGAPPMQLSSDPDMMVFPGDRHSKISGTAYLFKEKRRIHVFEIHVQRPGETRRRNG